MPVLHACLTLPPVRALGIDVGLRKGLDLVLLDEQRQVVDVAARLPHDRLREVVECWAPDAVAIDSPPRWAPLNQMRETERELLRRGIGLYRTPSFEGRSLKGFHDWMTAGMDAFRAIEDLYPLFSGGSPLHTAMEVFPHGTSVVLNGGLMPGGGDKRAWRVGILAAQGITDPRLRTADLVDATLAALTGLVALEDNACWRGRPEEGVIVLPCLAANLRERYVRTGVPAARPLNVAGSMRCDACKATNPAASRFCNQCGQRLANFEAAPS